MLPLIDKLARLLIIGNDEAETRNFADALGSEYHISAAPSAIGAAQRMKKETFGAMIFDLPDDGSNLSDSLQKLQQEAPWTPIIVISASQTADVIVKAIKAGAFDFITKPFAT